MDPAADLNASPPGRSSFADAIRSAGISVTGSNRKPWDQGQTGFLPERSYTFRTHKETLVLISRELATAFNQQIGNEFGASMQYVSIAAHFQQRQLTLLAKLFMEQADEERTHAMKFVKYVLDTK